MTVLASGILLYRRDATGPRLLLLRHHNGGHWGFAKGRRDPDDAHEVETALREVEEETGFTDLMLDPSFRAEIGYRVRDDRGPDYEKRVVYFLAPAPDREPRLSHEHDEHAWADARRADELLAFGQLRDLARAALQALRE